MKAWRALENGGLALEELATPEPGAGGVTVRLEAGPLLSYWRQVLDGSLGYDTPARPFTPGTAGVGVIAAIGPGVYHLKPGQRVAINPHFVVDERTSEPAQVLLGLTAMRTAQSMQGPPATKVVQADWPDGTCADYARLPAAIVTPLPAALDSLPAARATAISKFAVPFGGLIRGDLRAGETIVVNGGSGYFGSAGALLALALGAARVVAAGRDHVALSDLAAVAGPRLTTVVLSGDAAADVDALRAAARGPIDLSLDLVGRADSAASTLAALRCLRRGGRLVLMGSVKEALPVMVGDMLAMDWSVMGCFMYPKDAPGRLGDLIAAGLLDLAPIRVQEFPLADFERAIDAAAKMRGLDLTALTMT
jgi:alcohol dehydrogenase